MQMSKIFKIVDELSRGGELQAAIECAAVYVFPRQLLNSGVYGRHYSVQLNT